MIDLASYVGWFVVMGVAGVFALGILFVLARPSTWPLAPATAVKLKLPVANVHGGRRAVKGDSV